MSRWISSCRRSPSSVRDWSGEASGFGLARRGCVRSPFAPSRRLRRDPAFARMSPRQSP
jgi:hypothetical protein